MRFQLAILCALVGCVSCGGSEDTVEPNTASPSMPASSTGVVGPVARQTDPAEEAPEGGAAEVGGTLRALDSDCLYVENADGKFVILWPHGTSWDETSNAVVTARGELIALGDRFLAVGRFGGISASALATDSDGYERTISCASRVNVSELAVVTNQASSVRPAP